MSDYMDNEKEADSWNNLLAPQKDHPLSIPTRPGKTDQDRVFDIDEGEYLLKSQASKKKLAFIAEDINKNNTFAFETQKWCINEYSINNTVLKNIMIEHLSRKFGITITADEVLCFILRWKKDSEAICFTEKSTRSYLTSDKLENNVSKDENSKEAQFNKSDAPELIIYTDSGEKYNVKMPAWNRDKFYNTLKITNNDNLIEEKDDEPSVIHETIIESKSEEIVEIENEVIIEVEGEVIIETDDEVTVEIENEKTAEEEIVEAENEAAAKEEIVEAENETTAKKESEEEESNIEPIEQSGYSRLVASEAIEKLPKQFPIAEETPEPEKPSNENEIHISSRYCHSVYYCLQIYHNNEHIKPDNLIIPIEVPADKYPSVVQSMEESISRGTIPGLDNISQARTLVRKSLYTYKQIINTTRDHKIKHVHYDSELESVVTGYPYGLSAAVAYCLSIWNGDDLSVALKNAVFEGIRTNGTDFTAAISETPLLQSDIIKLIDINQHTSYTPFTAVDIFEMLKSRILGGKPHLNLSATKKPDEKSIWGRIKNIFGGKPRESYNANHEILRHLNEDALELMLKFIAKTYKQLSEDFLLNKREYEWTTEKICTLMSGRFLRDIYLNEHRLIVIDEAIRPLIQTVINGRKVVTPPDREQLKQGLLMLLEERTEELP